MYYFLLSYLCTNKYVFILNIFTTFRILMHRQYAFKSDLILGFGSAALEDREQKQLGHHSLRANRTQSQVNWKKNIFFIHFFLWTLFVPDGNHNTVFKLIFPVHKKNNFQWKEAGSFWWTPVSEGDHSHWAPPYCNIMKDTFS